MTSHEPATGLDPAGPRVVAIGGGHGLARSLGAIRRYASECTAIVSVADDGGSSGRLREALGIPAPGDIRRCIGALLSEQTPLGLALEHRFDAGELEGHAFGNLLIAALTATTGDFVAGIAETCRLLRTVGAVLPATSDPVVLKAEELSGSVLEGQLRIATTGGIRRVSLIPPDASVPDDALEAIARADQIVIGPGSLYTSVLAALAPQVMAEQVANARGQRIYVANLRGQIPETAGYDIGRHVVTLIAHGIAPDVVCADATFIALGEVPGSIPVVVTPLAGPNGHVHDEKLLAAALLGCLG